MWLWAALIQQLTHFSCVYHEPFTLCGAEVALVDGAGIVVHRAYPHTPLEALDLGQPVGELHLLWVLDLHPVPWKQAAGGRQVRDGQVTTYTTGKPASHFIIFPEKFWVVQK